MTRPESSCNRSRRDALRTGISLVVVPAWLTSIAGCHSKSNEQPSLEDAAEIKDDETEVSKKVIAEKSMKIQYLEIVTPEVDALCQQYSAIYDLTFGEPDASFGGARTAALGDGGMMGIRGPLRDTETPVVRPYVLVEDIKAAVEAATAAGAEVAMPPMQIPEHGTFAIVINGGIECGFWQN